MYNDAKLNIPVCFNGIVISCRLLHVGILNAIL